MKTIRKVVAVGLLVAVPAGVYATDVLTGKNGMTLYTFDADSAGRSNCNDGCLVVWPAARPGDASGTHFSEITRPDGTPQLTYAGKPLYYYVNDRKPGDRNGDNVQKVWHAAVPAAKASARPVSAPAGYGSTGY